MSFIQQVQKDSINLKDLSIKEKEGITDRIKSSIARQIWRNEGYYEILNRQDEMIKTATAILNK